MVNRPRLIQAIEAAMRRSPITVVLGPRQSGKTTLARMIAAGRTCEYLDLEDPADQARLGSPMTALERMAGLVIIDEAQRRPDLFEILRVLVDRPDSSTRFLLLGSASPGLVTGVSESLAGRAAFVDMAGFDLSEVGPENVARLWLRGGLPRSYLAASDADSYAWRGDFIRTLLERDIPQLGISIPAEALRRFWTMIAHYHAQTFNAAEFSRSMGLGEKTMRRYLDILSGAYLVRQLPPWYANVGKRQVKAPKVFVRDSGLLHALLSLDSEAALQSHPKLGASWEGFAVDGVLTLFGRDQAYYWATHGGAELDLLVFRKGERIGFECKYADAPRPTRSMRVAMTDLELDRLYVVYPGRKSFPLDKRIEALSIRDLFQLT